MTLALWLAACREKGPMPPAAPHPLSTTSTASTADTTPEPPACDHEYYEGQFFDCTDYNTSVMHGWSAYRATCCACDPTYCDLYVADCPEVEVPALRRCVETDHLDAVVIEYTDWTEGASFDVTGTVVDAGAGLAPPASTPVLYDACSAVPYALVVEDDDGFRWNVGFGLDPDPYGDLANAVVVGARVRIWASWSANWEWGSVTEGLWIGAEDGALWFAAGTTGAAPMHASGVEPSIGEPSCFTSDAARRPGVFEPGSVVVEPGFVGVVPTDPPTDVLVLESATGLGDQPWMRFAMWPVPE